MDDHWQNEPGEEIARLKKQLAEQAAELERKKRQLEIEHALDNLRLRAVAMRSSAELGETSVILFQQLTELGINPIRTAVGIFDEPNEAMELWLTSFVDTGEMTRILYYFSLHIHPIFENVIADRKQNKAYSVSKLSGNALKGYYQTLSTYLSAVRQQVLNETEYFYFFFFSHGTINVVANEPLTEEQCRIMIRFAQVFGLIYTRFLDLQRAEKSSTEAQFESALERVRARAQSMQQPDEIKEVTKLFREEMGKLGIHELETCHIYLYDQKARVSECWLALKNDRTTEKLVSDEFELDLHDTWAGREMLRFYESASNEVSIVMTADHYEEWTRYCAARSETFRLYAEQLTEETYHLCKFSHGAIGQPDISLISQENWDMLKRVASVFSLVYSRFRDLTQARIDLQNLKEEKSRAENALAELKATQRQLIQAEKMASLGELTTGIAHEIQNPLNFVNNFSELNSELINELKEQLGPDSYREGNSQNVIDIIDAIDQNLTKINQHGKRADAIVKGMLQHSRVSTGHKEPTDINHLADEFLRLAYHGLWAKDKDPVGIGMKTDFDNSIGKINIVAQDIGRLLLNLYNNAFYAVKEKQAISRKLQAVSYEPVVTVTTRKDGEKIIITVADNGIGIPQNVMDKIFQPFFTTKPTGQGTGLGLSLAYDIVKAHDGEIKIANTEGGATFIVRLPL